MSETTKLTKMVDRAKKEVESSRNAIDFALKDYADAVASHAKLAEQLDAAEAAEAVRELRGGTKAK